MGCCYHSDCSKCPRASSTVLIVFTIIRKIYLLLRYYSMGEKSTPYFIPSVVDFFKVKSHFMIWKLKGKSDQPLLVVCPKVGFYQKLRNNANRDRHMHCFSSDCMMMWPVAVDKNIVDFLLDVKMHCVSGFTHFVAFLPTEEEKKFPRLWSLTMKCKFLGCNGGQRRERNFLELPRDTSHG